MYLLCFVNLYCEGIRVSDARLIHREHPKLNQNTW